MRQAVDCLCVVTLTNRREREKFCSAGVISVGTPFGFLCLNVDSTQYVSQANTTMMYGFTHHMVLNIF